MALKTIALQDLLMAPVTVHPRIGKAEVILAFLAPALFPVDEGGTVSGYKPGFIEILPFAKRGRFTSMRAYLAKRIYRKPQLLLGLILFLCFCCALVVDFIYAGNCGDFVLSDYPGCPSAIWRDSLFQGTLEAAGVAVALLVAIGVAMSFDPRVQSEGWVTMPGELLTLLKGAREVLVAVNKRKTLDEQEPGFAKGAGKGFATSSAGAIGRALAGPFGELVATVAAEGALEKDSGNKLQEWKDRTRMEIRLHAAQAILDQHRRLTGRPPVDLPAEVFASGENWSDGGLPAAPPHPEG
jgi:hypothetical protein